MHESDENQISTNNHGASNDLVKNDSATATTTAAQAAIAVVDSDITICEDSRKEEEEEGEVTTSGDGEATDGHGVLLSPASAAAATPSATTTERVPTQLDTERSPVTSFASAAKTSVQSVTETEKGEGGGIAGIPGTSVQTSDTQAASPTTDATAAAAALPVMKGTFSYDLEQRRHLIRGMWNFENSTQFPPQRFELLRTLPLSEDLTKIPQNGEFHGSFSLAYMHTTSKGKQKERSKVIPESGVQIKFIPEGDGFTVDGTGTNQFGVFHINGTAAPSGVDGDPTLNVVLRKRYDAQPISTAAAVPVEASDTADESNIPLKKLDPPPASLSLPPPSKSFPSGVVCLRGNLFKEESNDLGVTEVVHRITGTWAAGLDVFASDPENVRKQQNRFEYEHKSSVPSTSAFPVSGRYSGWFDLSNDDGTRTRINERDVTLKFRKNSVGFYNVEGKGSNVFGKYSITGTLEGETITIFRHFQPRKLKNKTDGVAPAVVASNSVGPLSILPGPPALAVSSSSGTVPPAARRPSAALQVVEPKFKLDDVVVPEEADRVDSKLEPTNLPTSGTYSAVSRGVLRLNEDGSYSCQGKWAVTREHFTNGQTSNFNFRLESHLAVAPADRPFPVDSELYKGSFQLKKQGSRYQTIVDHQLVMKFRMNSQGSYNVYGKGFNVIGEFNLVGTLVMSGKTGGQVELYRMYPPEKLGPTATPTGGKTMAPSGLPAAPSVVPSLKPDTVSRSASVSLPGPPPPHSLQRRESTRLVKLPSKLEDDDPSAVISRAMNKCSQILRFMREKDVEMGGFFSEPVDPVALGIPTYNQIIKEPMDLRTIHRRMESESLKNPEEFARLCRLVFENAMTFNIDPVHSVHQAGRSLLVLFNQKFRDVERLLQNVRRSHEGDDKGKKKGKDEKKRKRQPEEAKSLKRRRLEEAQAMAAANANAVAAIVAAAPSVNSPHVTRSEFTMLLNVIQELQRQVVQTHTAVADLCPGDEAEPDAMSVTSVPTSTAIPSAPAPSAISTERKKPVKRKSEAISSEVAPIDDSMPLTLDEQELLTETINDLPPEHLGGVIQIIREAAPVGADEDEIDLEIDQLDTKTQRKLLRHVSKFVKKSKVKKKPKQAQPVKKSEPSSSSNKPKGATSAPPPVATSKAASDSFFGFNEKEDDSDSDSNDEDSSAKRNAVSQQPGGGKTFGQATASEFQLGAGLGDFHDGQDDDHDDELDNGGLAAKWNMSKAEETSEKSEDEDDAWGAAREHAAAAKAREAERKAREEKMKAEAEAAKEQRLADAAARGNQLRAQRLEEEANEARLREQQEKEAEEARKAAREAARAQVQSVEQTVDLDAQRDIMKQYEQSFMDKDLGSASPSSDFGF